MPPTTPEEPISDPVFRELSYDPPLEQWHAKAALASYHEIEIAIWWDETDGPFDPVLQQATQAFKMFQASELQHRGLLAAAMLGRYQQSARPENVIPSVSVLAQGLEVDRVSIASDGSLAVEYYDDWDLFEDHSILAEIAADGTFVGFTLQG